MCKDYSQNNTFYIVDIFCFQDLLNFEDPLNVEAAEHYARDKVT